MDWRHAKEVIIAGEETYGELKNLCIWNKTNAGMGSLYRSKHELIFVFKVGKGPHINNVALGRYGRHRTNVWDYVSQNALNGTAKSKLALHPTVKPVALIADAICDCSNRGDVILDPFGGAGTTLIAAERTGRRARVIELDPRFADVSVARWQRLTGGTAVHAESGRPFGGLPAQVQHPARSLRRPISPRDDRECPTTIASSGRSDRLRDRVRPTAAAHPIPTGAIGQFRGAPQGSAQSRDRRATHPQGTGQGQGGWPLAQDPTQAGALMVLREKALKGDARSLARLLELASRFNNEPAETELQALSTDDQAILAAFMAEIASASKTSTAASTTAQSSRSPRLKISNRRKNGPPV